MIGHLVFVTLDLHTLDYISGGSRISGKGVHMYKGVGARFADMVSFYLNFQCE